MGHSVGPLNARELAGVLSCGPGAVVSHHSAAGLWVMVRRPVNVDVRVTVPGHRLRNRKGICVSFVEAIDPRDRRMTGPVPVTSPARTIVDMAGVLEPDRLEPLIADAQGRRLPRHATSKRRSTEAPTAPGIAGLRCLLHVPKLTRREGERRLLKLIREAGLPEPECNVPVGPYVVDFLWRERKLVAEFDSRECHGEHVHGRFESDRRRDGRLLALGYRTKRVTWKELDQEPEELTALLRTLLRRSWERPAAPR